MSRRDVSEDKLKELQRREALADSDEYDIRDSTYDNVPMTRQYVKDDVVVKGSELVDGDGEIIRPNDGTHDDMIYDDTVITFVDEPQIDTKPQKQPEVKFVPKRFEPISTDRDYIDRNAAIHEEEQQFKKIEKPKKEKKPLNLTWVKPVVCIVLIVISIIAAFGLYDFTANFKSSQQEASIEKQEYIEFVNKTNNVIMAEGNVGKTFQLLNEQFVMDMMTQDEYMRKLKELSSEIMSELQKYTLVDYEHVDENEIKKLTIDYLKILITNINNIVVLENGDVKEIKEYLLNESNDAMVQRSTQFTNIVNLINTTSKQYNLNSQVKDNVIYFDINMD